MLWEILIRIVVRVFEEMDCESEATSVECLQVGLAPHSVLGLAPETYLHLIAASADSLFLDHLKPLLDSVPEMLLNVSLR